MLISGYHDKLHTAFGMNFLDQMSCCGMSYTFHMIWGFGYSCSPANYNFKKENTTTLIC